MLGPQICKLRVLLFLLARAYQARSQGGNGANFPPNSKSCAIIFQVKKTIGV